MNDNTPTPTWEAFACYLVDRCEGETITEENIQFWAANMLKTQNYANIVDPMIKEYEIVIESNDILVRELDFLLNGLEAAKQASLCDIVSQLRLTKMCKCKVISLRLARDNSERLFYLTNVITKENGVIVGHVTDGGWAFVYEPETQQLKYCDYVWQYPQDDWVDDGEYVIDEQNPVTVHTAKLQWSIDIPIEHKKDSSSAFDYAEKVITKVKNESQWGITTSGVTIYTYPSENIEHDVNNLVYTASNEIKE